MIKVSHDPLHRVRHDSQHGTHATRNQTGTRCTTLTPTLTPIPYPLTLTQSNKHTMHEKHNKERRRCEIIGRRCGRFEAKMHTDGIGDGRGNDTWERRLTQGWHRGLVHKDDTRGEGTLEANEGFIVVHEECH